MTSVREEIRRLEREVGWTPLDEEDPDAIVAAKRRPPDAVPTPFPTWNAVCRDEGGGKGVAHGWHITVAAKTGAGKSVIAGNLARAAIAAGERVGFISLEMSKGQLDTRQLSIISGEPIRLLEQGPGFEEAALRRALRVVREIKDRTGGQLFRSDALLRDAGDIESAVQFMVHGPPGCRMFIVDYIQLAGNPNDPESITDVSHRIRALAYEHNVVTVGLSQFNRSTYQRDSRPTIHDLTGGSAIENDSDQVVILDHTEMQQEPGGWTAPLVIAKNRHGPQTEMGVRFTAKDLRFTELMPDEGASYEVGGR